VRSLLTAAAISLAFTLFLTPVFLRLFRKWGWGQVIRTPEDIRNPNHQTKRGTPTMGGTIFIVGTIVGYLVGCYVGNNPPTVSGLLVIWMMVGLGAVGFIDDYMKVRQQKFMGLSGWRKIAGQVVVTVPFGIVALNFPNQFDQTPASPYVSVFRDVPVLGFMTLGLVVGWILYLAWVTFIGVAFSNSVNVTDGLDGLATGAAIFVTGAYSLIAFWQFNQACWGGDTLSAAAKAACYPTRDPFDLAIISASFVGALVGFLWWNAPKAKEAEMIASVFIIGPGSVILQRLYFKVSRGRRLFLMSPFHHHLEMRGWSEVTIVVRMWIIAGLLAVSGVGFFYVEWLSRT